MKKSVNMEDRKNLDKGYRKRLLASIGQDVSIHFLNGNFIKGVISTGSRGKLLVGGESLPPASKNLISFAVIR